MFGIPLAYSYYYSSLNDSSINNASIIIYTMSVAATPIVFLFFRGYFFKRIWPPSK